MTYPWMGPTSDPATACIGKPSACYAILSPLTFPLQINDSFIRHFVSRHSWGIAVACRCRSLRGVGWRCWSGAGAARQCDCLPSEVAGWSPAQTISLEKSWWSHSCSLVCSADCRQCPCKFKLLYVCSEEPTVCNASDITTWAHILFCCPGMAGADVKNYSNVLTSCSLVCAIPLWYCIYQCIFCMREA